MKVSEPRSSQSVIAGGVNHAIKQQVGARSVKPLYPVMRIDLFFVQDCFCRQLSDDRPKGVAVRGDCIEEPWKVRHLTQDRRTVDCRIDAGPCADKVQVFQGRQRAGRDPEIAMDTAAKVARAPACGIEIAEPAAADQEAAVRLLLQ